VDFWLAEEKFVMTNSPLKGLSAFAGLPFGSLSPNPYSLAGLGVAPPQHTTWWWQGASNAWFIHSIFDFAETTSIQSCNYIMVRREFDGRRTALYIGQSGDFSTRLPNHEKFAAAQRLGADELHLHFLANSPSERFRIETDLRNGHNPSLNEQGNRSANALATYPYSSPLARALGLLSK
jgi:hypothetical protein